VLYKGPPGGAAVQGVSDCVVRNIGYVVGALDDPDRTSGDDPHGHGIAVYNAARPLIIDSDIRDNYDGVMIWDPTADPGNPDQNPQLYTSDAWYNANWEYQRIRLNARFGVGVRAGATPYIGKWGGDIWVNANDIQANGYANVASQDSAAPRIYYNFIEGVISYYYTNEDNPSRMGVICKDKAAPVIVGNYISDHNLNGVAAKDEAAPEIGPAGSYTDRDDPEVNQILFNNIYAGLPASDERHLDCGYGLAENIYCAAVGAASGARPQIRNNHIYYNRWTGVGSRDWAVPVVEGNWVEKNVIGVALQTVRPSVLSEVRIGKAEDGSGYGNEIRQNRQGLVMINCGTRD